MRLPQSPLAPAQSSRQARTRRLRLEPLEPREVPAAGPEYCLLPPFRGVPEPAGLVTTGRSAYPPDLSETFRLHSRPTADHVIYLDFDGHVTTGTRWNADAGYGFIDSPAYDPSGNGPAFTDLELERIQYVWQRVAEDFSPFDVDVTTEFPGLDRLRNSGPGDTGWGVRVVIGGDGQIFGYPGGVAYLNTFTSEADTPVFVFSDNLANGHEKYTADAISHEVGHALGLEHDGRGLAEYYAGHGSGSTGWAPIMGVGYYRKLTQWSRGEYPGATNREDDLAVITTRNGFGFRPDDHGDDAFGATDVTRDGLTGISGAGLIGQRADADYFRFTTGPGPISLTVRPAARDPNLDVRAELYDAAGNRVAVANPAGGLAATVAATVPAGEYYLKVDGVGKGTAYSDYDSLGQYSFTGIVHEMPSPTPPRVAGVTATESAAGKVTGLRLTFDGPMDPATVTLATVRVTGPAGQLVPVTAVRPVRGSDREFDVLFRPQALAGAGGLRVFVSPTVRSTWPNALDQNPVDPPGQVGDFFAGAVYRVEAGGGPIADAGTTDFPLTITRSLRVTDLNVRVNLTHPFVSDLEVQLVSPGGAVVPLFAHRGADGNDLKDTRFDDQAAGGLGSAAAPFVGVFKPDGRALASLAGGDAQGTWLLRVIDSYAGAAGQVSSWGLTIGTDTAGVGAAVAAVTPVNELGSALVTRVSSLELAFAGPMNPATVTPADVKVTGPGGKAVPVLSVTPIVGTNNTRFRVTTALWARAGTYTVRVGPAVADVYGNGLDGNANGLYLEAADAHTATVAVRNNVHRWTGGPALIRQGARPITPAIRVATPVTIGSVAVELSLVHPRLSDLTVMLIAPDGERFALMVNDGGSGPGLVRAVFADVAAAAMPDGPGPHIGDFQPTSELSRLAGRSARGTWKLEVFDRGTGALGTLLSWGLYITPQ